MSSVTRREQWKKYRQENYSSVTNPYKRIREMRKGNKSPTHFPVKSKFDRFCFKCRLKISGMNV